MQTNAPVWKNFNIIFPKVTTSVVDAPLAFRENRLVPLLLEIFFLVVLEKIGSGIPRVCVCVISCGLYV